MTIALDNLLDKLPIEQIKQTIHEHLRPLTARFPDQRLKTVAEEMVLGILGSESPLITHMVRQNDKSDGEVWATAKRSYRFLENARLTPPKFTKGSTRWGARSWRGNPPPIWWWR